MEIEKKAPEKTHPKLRRKRNFMSLVFQRFGEKRGIKTADKDLSGRENNSMIKPKTNVQEGAWPSPSNLTSFSFTYSSLQHPVLLSTLPSRDYHRGKTTWFYLVRLFNYAVTWCCLHHMINFCAVFFSESVMLLWHHHKKKTNLPFPG